MAQLRYPALLDTARVGTDGNLEGFCFRIFENPVGGVPEGSMETGPEITDAAPVVMIAHSGTVIPVAYTAEGYCPTAPVQVEVGSRLVVSIPASSGPQSNVVIVEVQPAL